MTHAFGILAGLGVLSFGVLAGLAQCISASIRATDSRSASKIRKIQ